MTKRKYGSAFYTNLQKSVDPSAREIVPLLIKWFHPRSVVDYGCGTGNWLASFKNCGVETILGFDGEWVSEEQLMIDKNEFRRCDLSVAPFVDLHFDMAICLEVGEHLPEAAAARLVDALTTASSIVIFSAAIPFQGGSSHVNEQWPEYWAELFASRRFRVLDILRPTVWNDPQVEPYYAQNMLAFIGPSRFEEFKGLATSDVDYGLTRIHPALWESKMVEASDFSRLGTLQLLRALPHSVARSLRARFGTR